MKKTVLFMKRNYKLIIPIVLITGLLFSFQVVNKPDPEKDKILVVMIQGIYSHDKNSIIKVAIHPLRNTIWKEEVMSINDVRRSKNDRRSKLISDDKKVAYKGSERRSGKKRRIWIDRLNEISEKFNNEEQS